MPVPFSRTLRSLSAERPRGLLLALAGAGVLLLAWSAWFTLARVPVHVTSREAFLQAGAAAHPVAAPVAGRLTAVHAEVGREVEAGEVLFELDAEMERRRIGEEEARHHGVEEELDRLRQARATEERALARAGDVARSATAEARSEHQAAAASRKLAGEELNRAERLLDGGLLSEMEVERLRSAAAEAEARERSAAASLARLEAEEAREREDRRAHLDELDREIARLEGSLSSASASLHRLEEEMDRRLLRAPVAGRIGAVERLRPGAVVEAGTELATVIPDSALRIAAAFHPGEALARVRPGQSAELRLDGFPWTEYGSLAARVNRVSSEPRDGRIWVEAELEPPPDGSRTSALPVEHGLPGVLVVEVEHLSPARLVLRSAGRMVRARDSSAAPPGTPGATD